MKTIAVHNYKGGVGKPQPSSTWPMIFPPWENGCLSWMPIRSSIRQISSIGLEKHPVKACWISSPEQKQPAAFTGPNTQIWT